MMEDKDILAVLTQISSSLGLRDAPLASLTNAVTRLEMLVQEVEKDVKKVVDCVDGNNGDGLRTRVKMLENEVKELKGEKIAPNRMREILLGALITLVLGVAMFFFGRAMGVGH